MSLSDTTEPVSDAVLSIWTVYEHPTDYPGGYVARRHEVRAGSTGPTAEAVCSDRIEPIRDYLMAMGLTCLPRDPADEPQIVESWI